MRPAGPCEGCPGASRKRYNVRTERRKQQQEHRNAHRRRQRTAVAHRRNTVRGRQVRQRHSQADIRRLDTVQHEQLEGVPAQARHPAHPAVPLHPRQECHRQRPDHRRDGRPVRRPHRRLLHRVERQRLHQAGHPNPGVRPVRHGHRPQGHAGVIRQRHA